MKRLLVVLDFDGLLVDSYALIRAAFADFDLDVGDARRFRDRRKFLKYLGGGREILPNLVRVALPRKRRIRAALTAHYRTSGRLFEPFVPYLNAMIAAPRVHVGIVSRNFTINPGMTIRQVLINSGIDEANLDFIIPISAGVKKHATLEGMNSSRYKKTLFGGDEIGDYKAALETGYDKIMIGSYGFDNRQRLVKTGKIPEELIYDTQSSIVQAFEKSL